MTTYIAVDPGGTTGVAMTGNGQTVATWELSPMEAVELVEDFIDENSVVVCESFTPRPGVRTWQPDAVEVIGALRYLCFKRGLELVLQSPAAAKRFGTDDKLKRIGWYKPTRGGHSNDAVRHLLIAMVRNGDIDVGRLT